MPGTVLALSCSAMTMSETAILASATSMGQSQKLVTVLVGMMMEHGAKATGLFLPPSVDFRHGSPWFWVLNRAYRL